jgi:hypothetical protein
VSFLAQLNMELEKGEYFLWRELRTPDHVIARFRQKHLHGGRVIIEAENVLQLIYRLQFERLLNINFAELANTDWTISASPIDLPMSDIGLIQIHLETLKANYYLLPLGPRLLLEGVFYHDLSRNSVKTSIRRLEMTQDEAEYTLDCICLSSVREIIYSQKNFEIPANLERAKTRGFRFNRIIDPDLIKAAGAKHASLEYGLRCVSRDDYRRFIHSYIMPPLSQD